VKKIHALRATRHVISCSTENNTFVLMSQGGNLAFTPDPDTKLGSGWSCGEDPAFLTGMRQAPPFLMRT